MKVKDLDYKTVLSLSAGAVVLYFILKPSKAAKEEKEQGKQNTAASTKKAVNAFSDVYGLAELKKKGYKTVNPYLIPKGYTTERLKTIAEQIYNSPGFFNDNEQSLYNIFRNLKSIVICSLLSKVFLLKFKKDLHSFLADFLSADELSKVVDIINSKKNE